MTARVIVAPAASRDLNRILAELYHEAGFRTFARYRDHFDYLFFERLSAFPETYQARPKLGAYVRAAILRPYLVLYRFEATGDLVEIVRIVHGRRKITRKFLTEA